LNVCRGLFNDHKRIFSFLVSATIQQRTGTIPKSEWNVFCKGSPILKEKAPPLPAGLGISEKIWKNLVGVASVVPNI